MKPWHYIHNGQQLGPVDQAHLAALLRSGELPPDTQVWQEGMASWLQAKFIAEFQVETSAANQPVGGGDDDTSDIQKNKLYAILAYLPFLFIVAMLVAPKSRFARFHANQGLILCVAEILRRLAAFVLWQIPYAGQYLGKIADFLGIGVLLLMILGVMHAARGENKRLPLIGNHDLLR